MGRAQSRFTGCTIYHLFCVLFPYSCLPERPTSQKENVSSLSWALSKLEASALPVMSPLPFPSVLYLGSFQGSSGWELATTPNPVALKSLQQKCKMKACFHRLELLMQQGPPERPGCFISTSPFSGVISEGRMVSLVRSLVLKSDL